MQNKHQFFLKFLASQLLGRGGGGGGRGGGGGGGGVKSQVFPKICFEGSPNDS